MEGECNMRETLYDRGEVCKKLNINLNTLGTWICEGLIFPCRPAKNQGSPAYFNETNLLEIRLLRRLIEGGISRKLARRLLDDAAPSPTVDGKYRFTIGVDLGRGE